MLGALVVLVALADLFLTVLYARSGVSVFSNRFHEGCWRLFRGVALALPRYRDRLLAFAGPSLLVLTVTLWVALLLGGFALIAWPAMGTAIQATAGEPATGFFGALYYAGESLTTLGMGDVVPHTQPYRLLAILQAGVGFSVFSLSLTFFTSVYSALVRRNTFALGLHHRTSGTADAAVLLAQLGPQGDFSDARSELTTMAEELINLYESHHTYPVLHYFRFQDSAYSLARMALLTLDTATLVRTALDERAYPSLVRSSAVAALWGGGLQLLEGMASTYLPQPRPGRVEHLEGETEQLWRAHYHQAVEKLRAEGVAVVEEVAAGAEKYIALRREWGAYVAAFADYMLYDWNEVASQESGLLRS